VKPLDRFTIDHHNYQGGRLHNDLNKMVQQVNDALASLQSSIHGNAAAVTAAGEQIASISVGGGGGGGSGSGSLSTMLIVNKVIADSPFAATLSALQYTLFQCSASAGADFIFDLPPATGSGEVAIVKKMDANAHNIVITPNGTDTIDGTNATVSITIQMDAVKLVDSAAGAWSVWP
jgi:hypothetical protein